LFRCMLVQIWGGKFPEGIERFLFWGVGVLGGDLRIPAPSQTISRSMFLGGGRGGVGRGGADLYS